MLAGEVEIFEGKSLRRESVSSKANEKLFDGKVYFTFKVFLISMIYDFEPSRARV